MSAFTPSRFPCTLLCTAIVAGATLSASAAASSFDGAERSATVQYQDLDLASERDAGTLYQRLQTASRSVCRSLKSRDLTSVKRYRDCYTKALGDAVSAINERALTALHTRPAERTVRANRDSMAEGA